MMTAEERIKEIRSGNHKMYESEVDRTIGVINDRMMKGKSIEAQKDWLDAISYAYFCWLAPGVCVPIEQVEKNGYAERIIEEEKKRGNL